MHYLFGHPLRLVYSAIILAITSAAAVADDIPVYMVTHFAGAPNGAPGTTDGKGDAARFFNPTGVALDSAGNVFVADGANGTIRKITPDGTTTTLAGTAGQYGGVDGTGPAARFGPRMNALAIDSSGNLYVTEWDSATVRKITPSGVVTTVAGSFGQKGNVDGTGGAARFRTPSGIAVDSSGNIYISDVGNDNIRKITSSGVVTTYAGSIQGSADGIGTAAAFDSPYAVAVDSAGTLYVTDSLNSTIRRITTDRMVTTIAGTTGSAGSSDGVGPAARFSIPAGITVAPSGDIYVADTNNSIIRRISSDRTVRTIAGTAGARGVADGVGSAARFTLPSGIAVDNAGNVFIADGGGNSIRKAAAIDLTINSQPASQTAVIGSNVTFSITATNATSYRWVREDGTIMQDSASSSLTFSSVNSGNAGNYYVIVTGPAGSAQSSTFTLTVVNSASQLPKLINISTRSYVGTDADVMIAGFVIGGTAPKTVLIRATGPTLAQYGVSGALPDPVLSLNSDNTVIATNDNWGDDPVQKAATLQAFQAARTSPWMDGTKDSALVATLAPGPYTAIVKGVNRSVGAALVEVYEVDIANTASKLVNISTRSLVRTGDDVQIGGFIISGTGPKKVMIRASGPALIKYGVGAALADPKVELRAGNDVVASNDDWNASLRPEFQKLGIDNWEVGSKDAALVITLMPGAYTAIVSGNNNGTGVALIEVFEMN